MSKTKSIRVAVFGAGSIGCYVGGRLAASGVDCGLIGRPRVGGELAEHGLRLTDWLGTDLHLAPAQIEFATTADALAGADLVLVCVKSAATAQAAAEMAPHLAPGSLVLSFQNGLSNAEVLRAALPGVEVLAGMVPFNVVSRGQGRFHQGSEGSLEVQRADAVGRLSAVFLRAGLPLVQHADMTAVLWSKLLLNLNNSLNALSGLPLKTELSQRAYRRCLALLQGEALNLLAVAGQKLVKLTPVPPRWLPRLLDVPDPVFRVLANRMLAIDPLARSSMWEDLEAGRRTEIDWINGEVVSLASRMQRTAPANARVVELIRAAESGGCRDWTGPALWAELRSARD